MTTCEQRRRERRQSLRLAYDERQAKGYNEIPLSKTSREILKSLPRGEEWVTLCDNRAIGRTFRAVLEPPTSFPYTLNVQLKNLKALLKVAKKGATALFLKDDRLLFGGGSIVVHRVPLPKTKEPKRGALAVSFNLTRDNLTKLQKHAKALGLDTLEFCGEGEHLTLRVFERLRGMRSDCFEIEEVPRVDQEARRPFRGRLPVSALRRLKPHDYEVLVWPRPMTVEFVPMSGLGAEYRLPMTDWFAL
jgi:hypothetical protein